jgi:AmmeMemoRadiSam system protein A
MLTDRERRDLLRLALEAIAAHLRGDSPVVAAQIGSVARPSGVFVTLRSRGELRGCIGSLETASDLPAQVAYCAIASSTEDPRFPPLSPSELEEVELEISLLTQPEPVADASEIEVGRHGLIVEHGLRRGLLLPQVPIEWGWDRETFLVQTCLKAGLSPDAWRSGATLLRFEAEVFGEF